MLSYCKGPSGPPRLEETSGDKSRRTVERFGEREALVVGHQGHRVTGESFDPGQTLAAVAEPCASLYGMPTMFMAEFEQPGLEECDLSSLRTRITAGAPCLVELMKPVRARLHMIVTGTTQKYRMREIAAAEFGHKAAAR
jgi:acyl-CoA synthetase (AMP-forming)/AMP-acid ligase II